MMRSPSGSPACWRVRSASSGAEVALAEGRAGQLGDRLRDDQRAASRRAQPGRAVLGGGQRRMHAVDARVAVGHHGPLWTVRCAMVRRAVRSRRTVSSGSVGASVTASSGETAQRPAGGRPHLVQRRPRGAARSGSARRSRGSGRSMPRSVMTSVGPRAAQAEPLPVARPVAVPDRGDEVDLLHERPPALPQHHEHLAAVGRDLRRAAGAGQADRRVAGTAPITVVLMLANLSSWAAPRKPTSIRPGCSQ